MTTQPTTIECFEGIPEDLKTVKFKHDRSTGAQKIVMAFGQLRSLDRLQSFTKSSANVVRLNDTEGVITIPPPPPELPLVDQRATMLRASK
jgi:photosystem II Psb28-2 protein